MRRVRLDRAVSEGATLAHEVIGPGGEIIARTGYTLTQRTADALVARGVTWCFAEDAASAGAVIAPLDGGAGAVRAVLKSLWTRIADASTTFASMPTARAIEAMRRAQPTAAIRWSAAFTVLPEAAADIVSRAATIDARGGYVTARQSAADENGHALGVAALTSRIATLIGLESAEVVEATTAALLHDIGLVLVPATVRRAAPATWTAPERRRYEDHAVLGAALLAPLAEPSLHLSIVAGEHHEAQDGTGYPGRVTGGNRVLRTAEERRDAARIALLSEIVAVADHYERLLSPSPGYAGRSAAAARAILEAEAGTTLNREIVTRFLGTFPVLPLGTEVSMQDGPQEGAYGVVCSVPVHEGAAPRVRLIADPDGRPIAPVEVNVKRESVRLVPVDDTVAATASTSTEALTRR